MSRDPRAAPRSNVAGIWPVLVESPLGLSVKVVAEAVFGGPRVLKELTGPEAGQLGRQLIHLSDQIAARET